MSAPPRDPWFRLAKWSKARIAIGRVGASMPTAEVLRFALAHAQARDAVHDRLDRDALRDLFKGLGQATVDVESAAADRQVYLRRPDLGRRLSDRSRELLVGMAAPCDLVIVVGDGLSATAVNAHTAALVAAFLPEVARLGLNLGTIVIAEGARVALGDEIGAILGARAVAVVIGERPGLTAADSLGIYITYNPWPGRTDAQRNCISNVRPDGLAPGLAAIKLAWFVNSALTRQLTGVGLKDEMDLAISDASQPAIAPNTPHSKRV
jgi:ethanolamine ammonia-lyase small subunit